MLSTVIRLIRNILNEKFSYDFKFKDKDTGTSLQYRRVLNMMDYTWKSGNDITSKQNDLATKTFELL